MRLAILALSLGAVFAADAEGIKTAAARGMTKLVESASQWKQYCFSCHHQALPQMAAGAAREHGVIFDQAAMQKAADKAFAPLSFIDDALSDPFIIDPALSEGYFLAAHADWSGP